MLLHGSTKEKCDDLIDEVTRMEGDMKRAWTNDCHILFLEGERAGAIYNRNAETPHLVVNGCNLAFGFAWGPSSYIGLFIMCTPHFIYAAHSEDERRFFYSMDLSPELEFFFHWARDPEKKLAAFWKGETEYKTIEEVIEVLKKVAMTKSANKN